MFTHRTRRSTPAALTALAKYGLPRPDFVPMPEMPADLTAKRLTSIIYGEVDLYPDVVDLPPVLDDQVQLRSTRSQLAAIAIGRTFGADHGLTVNVHRVSPVKLAELIATAGALGLTYEVQTSGNHTWVVIGKTVTCFIDPDCFAPEAFKDLIAGSVG